VFLTMDLKRMTWSFKNDGKLVCVQGTTRLEITEHKINAMEMCGYEVKAFTKGNSDAVFEDFLATLHDAPEFFDFFLYQVEECSKKAVAL
jgi:hypothetical protein